MALFTTLNGIIGGLPVGISFEYITGEVIGIGNLTKDITLATTVVDVGSAFAFVSGTPAGNPLNVTAEEDTHSVELINTTTVRLTRDIVGTTASQAVDIVVMQLPPGLIKRKQIINTTRATGNANITITSVDTSKSVILQAGNRNSRLYPGATADFVSSTIVKPAVTGNEVWDQYWIVVETT